MRIKCFGVVRDFSGKDEVEIDPNRRVISVAELKEILENLYPELRTIKNYFIAVNHEFADEEALVKPEDELAIIPPVSGG